MKRIIAGGTGFIGQQLVKRWLRENHEIAIIGRSHAKINKIFKDQVQAITWPELMSNSAAILDNTEVIINLTGANIGAQPWTTKRKQEIISSRTESTTQLAEICASLGELSPPLFNASAVGVYGLQTSVANDLPSPLDETTPIDYQQAPDFLAEVGHAWELAAMPAKNAGVRVVWMRFGVVLDQHGGVLPRLSLPVKLFLGGPIGSGQQAFSWITLIDLLRAIDFLLQHPTISGPINLVAPHCVTQKQLVKALGKALHRPSFIPTPAFILKLIFGQMAEELLLSGQNVFPKRLLELGFDFQYPDINTALGKIFNHS